LQNSKSSTLRIAIQFQEVDDTFISKRNRRSLDFSILILSIFFILFVQKTFFDFRNKSISFVTQIFFESNFFETRTINIFKKKKQETSEIFKNNQKKDILSIRINILRKTISTILENENLINNFVVQKLIN